MNGRRKPKERSKKYKSGSDVHFCSAAIRVNTKVLVYQYENMFTIFFILLSDVHSLEVVGLFLSFSSFFLLLVYFSLSSISLPRVLPRVTKFVVSINCGLYSSKILAISVLFQRSKTKGAFFEFHVHFCCIKS